MVGGGGGKGETVNVSTFSLGILLSFGATHQRITYITTSCMKDLVSQGLKAPSFQKWLEGGSGVFQRPEIDFMNLLRLGAPKSPPIARICCLVHSPIWPGDFSRACHDPLRLGISDKPIGDFLTIARSLRVALKKSCLSFTFPQHLPPSLAPPELHAANMSHRGDQRQSQRLHSPLLHPPSPRILSADSTVHTPLSIRVSIVINSKPVVTDV